MAEAAEEVRSVGRWGLWMKGWWLELMEEAFVSLPWRLPGRAVILAMMRGRNRREEKPAGQVG